MVGKESIGRSEVPSPEGGGGVTGILVSFLFKLALFPDRCYHLEINKNG